MIHQPTAIILSNGHLNAPAILRLRLAALDEIIVIAADGGSRHADPLGLEIAVVVGEVTSEPSGRAAPRR